MVAETPAHYKGEHGIQPFDIIDAFKLGFNLGNVVKYVCRADLKGEALKDLHKARVYLDREIARRQK